MSDTSDDPFQGRKTFTVESANAALPLVRAIAADLAKLARDVVDRRERVSLLRGARDPEARDAYGDELSQIEEELEKDNQTLREYVQELSQLGVEPKNGPEGLVDFPSYLDGRPIYLCWKLGEPEVLHWHDLEAGFRGRQALTADSAAGDGSEEEDSFTS